ncbi:phosphopantetheine-binding protein [Streptosporangium sp. NPDC002524]|uniref:phosphopantetheine-binding protein n=1 Tax=Streptosporangium sp. NPDC002524 TaxID=3154537 RepID=UPI0033238BE6
MTTTDLSEREISDRLLAFIRERFLSGDPGGELGEDSPLLEWGILNSLNTALLVSHIRDEMGIDVAFETIDPRAFKSVRGLTAALSPYAAQG